MADPNQQQPDEQDESDEDKAGRPSLDQEVARRYDPQALSRLVMRDAGRGENLDLHTRSAMEQRLGGSFANVRVFRGPLAEEITRRYQADAVTVGGTEMVMVREGARSNFQSTAGKALLAHELTHVQQQQRGLHFAASGGGPGGNRDIEAPAERAERQVLAGAHGGQEQAKKEKGKKDAKFWMAVKKEVLRLFREHDELDKVRDGHGSQ